MAKTESRLIPLLARRSPSNMEIITGFRVKSSSSLCVLLKAGMFLLAHNILNRFIDTKKREPQPTGSLEVLLIFRIVLSSREVQRILALALQTKKLTSRTCLDNEKNLLHLLQDVAGEYFRTGTFTNRFYSIGIVQIHAYKAL